VATLRIEIDLEHPMFDGTNEDGGFVLADMLTKLAGFAAREGVSLDGGAVMDDANERVYLLASNTDNWIGERQELGSIYRDRWQAA